MNDILLDPPPAPQPEKKDTLTFNKKNLAIAFLAVSIFILILAIVIPGSNSSSPVTTDAPASVQTYAPTPVVNKYDAYLEHVYNNSGQANSISKPTLIEYGDTICNALSQGKSISWIVSYLSENSTGYSDNALFASVVYGAITYICDEYKPDLNAYLAN
jgi:hypothetical protein